MQVTLNETEIKILNSILKEAIEVSLHRKDSLWADLVSDIKNKLNDGKH